MKTKYFLQRIDGGMDRVDQTIYAGWQKVVDKGGKPLYTGIGFVKAPAGPVIMGNPDWTAFSMMLRVMGAKPFEGTVRSGIYQEPEFVRVRQKTRIHIYEIHNHDEDIAVPLTIS